MNSVCMLCACCVLVVCLLCACCVLVVCLLCACFSKKTLCALFSVYAVKCTSMQHTYILFIKSRANWN